jgi:Fe-S-cluster containining protein
LIASFTETLIQKWRNVSPKNSAAIAVFLRRFARNLPPHRQFLEAHEAVFSQFDCLQCANCCKNSSPVFNKTDIRRIAPVIGLSESRMETEFLQADHEGDFIPKTKPCPFLEADNRCRIYDVRPKSCRGFPHTDHPEFWNRHARMAGNAKACPAALEIVDNFMKKG